MKYLGDPVAAREGICMQIENGPRGRRVVLRAWFRDRELKTVLELSEIIDACGAEIPAAVPPVRVDRSFPLAD